MITGQTNVRSSRFASGASHGIGRELGRFVATSMEVPWSIAKDRIGGEPQAVLFVDSMEKDVVDRQVADAPECDAVLAVGGGQAIDLGKYLSWKRGCRLVTIPTVLSVDAFVTPQAAVRLQHRVEYVGSATPDPLVIDYELLRTAPNQLNVAGVGDLLSIHTATRDWEISQQAGVDPHGFSKTDVSSAREILEEIIHKAGSIAVADDAGLLAIVEGYMRVNTLCLPVGHYRVEEGSEHYLFYELEERLGRPFIHGQIIGLGVLLMSRLQEHEPERIKRFMDRVGLDYQPKTLGIDRPTLIASLKALPEFVRKRNFWHTIIDERPIDEVWIESAVADLSFA